jgi:hypothetical protein
MAVANLGLVTARGGSNSTLGIAYVSFGTISYFGTSIQQTALDAFRLELCTSENEFVKCISIYDLLACLLAAIVAIGTYLVDPWVCTVCGLVIIAIAGYFLLFRLTAQDTVKADIQPALLPAFRTILENPLAYDVLVGNVVYSFGMGVSLAPVLVQLNFELFKHTKDIAIFLLGGFITAIPTSIFCLVYCEKRIGSGEWDVYETIVWVQKWATVIAMACFMFSITALVFDASVFFWLALVLVPVVFLKFLYTMCQQTIIRHCCLLDSLITYTNRFATYNMVLQKPGDITWAVASAVAYIFLYATGYKENDDDNLDDEVSERYDWTEGTMWYLRVSAGLLPAICFAYCWYWFGKFKIDSKVAATMKEKVAVTLGDTDGDTGGDATEGKGGASNPLLTTLLDSSSTPPEVLAPVDVEERSKVVMRFTGADQSMMMHFSVAENTAMSRPGADGERTLQFIQRWNVVNVVLAVVALVAIFTLFGLCLRDDHLDNVMIIVFTSLLLSLVALFEFLRVDPMLALGKVSADERVRLATDAVENATFLGKRMDTMLRSLASDRSAAVTVSEISVDTTTVQAAYKATALLSGAFFAIAIAGIAVAMAITF